MNQSYIKERCSRVIFSLGKKVIGKKSIPKFTPDGLNLKLHLKKSTEIRKRRVVLGSCSRPGKLINETEVKDPRRGSSRQEAKATLRDGTQG